MLRDPSRNSRRRSVIRFKIFTKINYFAKVDRLEDELAGEQEKYKSITEELEATFAECSGY